MTAPSRSSRSRRALYRRVAQVLIERPAAPQATLLALAFVTLSRLVVEQALQPTPNVAWWYLFLFWHYGLFYILAFFLYVAMLRITTGLTVRELSGPVSIGLFFGILPPILELLLFPAGVGRFVYFPEMSWTLFHPDQRLGETIGVWAMILTTGAYIWAATGRVRAAVASTVGAYVIVQAFSAYAILWMDLADTTPMESRFLVLPASFLGAAIVLWVAVRLWNLWPSLRRMHHGLPHAALAWLGASWSGATAQAAALAAVIVVGCVFVLMVQNDYFDAEQDAQFRSGPRPDEFDLAWVNTFAALTLSAVYVVAPLPALCGAGLIGAGLLYHSPSTRLKERFCLSYKCEGAGAAFAFAAGAVRPMGYADVPMLVPCLLVFGGATLLSAAKDWKDTESDRRARIPTYYVAFATDAVGETHVHRVLCALIALAIGLALGLSAVLVDGKALALAASSGALAVFGLWTLPHRHHAVSVAMFGYATMLSALAWGLWGWNG